MPILTPTEKAQYDAYELLKADKTYVDGKPTGKKNYIVGGKFATNPYQRGASGTVAAGTHEFTADRFYLSPTGAALTWTIEGAGRNFRIDGAVGNTKSYLRHRIEGNDGIKLYNNDGTWSIRVYDSIGGNLLKMVLDVPTVKNDFSTAAYFSHNEHTTSIGYNIITLPKNITADIRNGLQLELEITNGLTSGYLSFEYWQLEEGLVATSIENTNSASNKIDCERYTADLGQYTRMRATSYTTDTIEFFFPNHLRDTAAIGGVETTDWEIYSQSGVAQTGFTLAPATAVHSPYGTLVRGTKVAHGLTDGYFRVLTANKVLLDSELY